MDKINGGERRSFALPVFICGLRLFQVTEINDIFSDDAGCLKLSLKYRFFDSIRVL